MRSRRYSVILLVFLTAQAIYSQSRDFGIWYGINTEYPLKKKLEIDLSTMLRTFSDASRIDEFFLEGGLSYKVSKYLSLAASYRITDNLDDNDEFHVRHKLMTDIKGSGDIGDLAFTARLRFQRQDKTYFEDKDDEIPDYYGRIRLKTEYKTPSFPVNPYIAFETFCRMFEDTRKRFDKNRFSCGLEYKINKQHSVEVQYMFQRDFIPDLADIQILAIEYKFKFGAGSKEKDQPVI